jgi:predicted amidohydrolase YtcJ
VILLNARLGDSVVDVRIEAGRITEIGSIDSAGTDLEGRWLIPGLWDNHVHFSQWAMHRQRVDLSSATSAAHAASLVAVAARPPAGVVLVGGGFRDALWPDAPTAELLDAGVSDIPVVLISADLHCCWLNSAAMKRFGVSGSSSGLLREEECFAIVRALDDVSVEVLDDWVSQAAAAAAARGVVGIVDFEMGWSVGAWQRRMTAGFSRLRVRAGVYPQFLDRAIAEHLATGTSLAPLLEVGFLKVITDGSLNTRTAYCHDPYPGAGDYRGELTVAPGDLVELLRRAALAGFTPAVHAIGDAANTLALDAFEEVGCHGRIEHAQLLSRADVPRFAALGIVASVQPEHALDDRDVADVHWAGRTDRAFVLADLLSAGVELAFGSDAPVAPLDPWVAMAAAVGRDRGREPWHPEQKISPEAALNASVQSKVAAGGVADLVIVDRDPLNSGSDDLRTMPVAATMLAGEFTHNALSARG